MKKTFLGIGIGLILGIGTYLITTYTSEPTACECTYTPNSLEHIDRVFGGALIRDRDESEKGKEEKRVIEKYKKMVYKCKHKYYGDKNWRGKAREECGEYKPTGGWFIDESF